MLDRRLVILLGILTSCFFGLWVLLTTLPANYREEVMALIGVFAVGASAIAWHNRGDLTPRIIMANVATGAIALLLATGLIACGIWLVESDILPTLQVQWRYILISLVGVGAAYAAWRRARPPEPTPKLPILMAIEPPPPPSKALADEPDWEGLLADLTDLGDAHRLRQLTMLQRLHTILSTADKDAIEETKRTIRQELQRLRTAAAAEVQETEARDPLTQAVALMEWGTQKLPEIAELDLSDLLMAKTIADIRALHDKMEHVFVDHRTLLAIHPIDRDTAKEKCNARAAAAEAALPLLRDMGMRLSEELIQTNDTLSPFRSVTGFQVISLGEGCGYVTFEGNGRRAALQQAFGTNEAVLVEVRLFSFEHQSTRETIIRRVNRVRRWKGVTGD